MALDTVLVTDYWAPICDHCDADATGADAQGSTWGCDRHRHPRHLPLDRVAHWATAGIRKPLVRCDVTAEVWAAHVESGWTDCGAWAAPPGVAVNVPVPRFTPSALAVPAPVVLVEPSWTPHSVLDIFGQPLDPDGIPLPDEPDDYALYVQED